jgi:hypothetical protein
LRGSTGSVSAGEAHVRLNFAARAGASMGSPTPSGKAELYSETVLAAGLDPVAEFVPPRESRHGEGRGSFRSSFWRAKPTTS